MYCHLHMSRSRFDLRHKYYTLYKYKILANTYFKEIFDISITIFDNRSLIVFAAVSNCVQDSPFTTTERFIEWLLFPKVIGITFSRCNSIFFIEKTSQTGVTMIGWTSIDNGHDILGLFYHFYHV